MSKKSPQLRFEGFTDDWEERKLGDIFSERSERSGEGELISVTINSGIIRASELNRTDNSSDDKSNYKKVEVGDIAYNSMRMWQGASGYSPYEGILSPAYTVIFPKEGIDSKFFSYDFKRYDMIQTFKRNSQGLTSDTWNLKFPTLKSVKVMVPCFEEQKQISNFFESVDKTIALHQHKLDLLKEQKKGYLQKMFPKNGAKVPELRFAGFADDWEERKLSDVANHRGGTAIEKYFDKDGVYKVISIGSYGLNSQYVDQNIRAISNEITDGRVVNSGELTMVLNDKTANGTIIGRTLLVEKDNEYVINQRTEIISPKENFDSNFAYTILNGSFREKVKRIVQGGTQIYVNYPAVSNLNLELPKIEEQQKIGSFFKQLDDTIALHQRKLDLLKEQKKGFLQKMFV